MSEFSSSLWQTASVEIRSYWESLRHDGQVPLRSDVSPREIEGALPHAFILERIAPQVARFRVAGQALNRLIGSDARGMPLTAFFMAGSRDRAAAALEQVFQGPEVAEFDLRGPAAFGGLGRRGMTGRMLILPLRSDLGDITRALGCLVTSELTGRAPRRFDIEDVVATPVITGRPARASAPERPALRLLRGDVPGPVAAIERHSRPERPGASHLRLVATMPGLAGA
jgi:hypothetical protein